VTAVWLAILVRMVDLALCAALPVLPVQRATREILALRVQLA